MDKTDNSHAERVIAKRARQRMTRAWSVSDALNDAELRREHQVLGLVDGDFPRYRATMDEREPE